MSDDMGILPSEGEGHRCEYHDPCNQYETIPCVMDNDDNDPMWLCLEHAFAMGHCSICGQFWGGIESFDFGPGYCEHCKVEIESDTCDPDDDEGWEYDYDCPFPEYEP